MEHTQTKCERCWKVNVDVHTCTPIKTIEQLSEYIDEVLDNLTPEDLASTKE